MGNIRHFTLIELVTVLVLCIVATALLVPVLTAASANEAKEAACTNNLRELGRAVEMYRYDNDERFMMPQYPNSNKNSCAILWDSLLACPKLGNYVKPDRLNCPEMPIYLPERWKDPAQYSSPGNWMWCRPTYGYNAHFPGGVRRGSNGYDNGLPYTIAAVEEPSDLLILADSAATKREFGGPFLWPSYSAGMTVLWPRHSASVNVLYADGHVKMTASGETECGEKAAEKLYAKGAELETSATCPKMKCKWRAGLD